MEENYRDCSKHKNITKEREIYLFSNRDKTSCRDEIIKSHLKLVINISKGYRFVEPDFLKDLIQEGIIGLIEAIERFDPSFGFRFSTYAPFIIKNKIRSSIRKNVFVFYVPEKKVHEAFKVYKEIENQQKINNIASIDNVCFFTGYNEDKVLALISMMDFYFKNHDEYSRIDLNKIDFNLKLAKVMDAIRYFKKKDKEIIKLRYEENKTWREIGDILNMSHEGCRKRHNKIIKLLKKDLGVVLN